MADNYIKFRVYSSGPTALKDDDIGYNRGEIVTKLTHGTNIDDTELKSLHLMDDSTPYQNTSGKTAYVIVSISASTNIGQRRYKIWSAPTNDSKSAATEVFDSDNISGAIGWASVNTRLTSWLVPITNNHYIVLENVSGASPRNINILKDQNLYAVVIEQAP